jgi:HEAT repeat protein
VAVTGLLDALRRDSHLTVLATAANALLQFRDSRIVPALIEGLRDPGDWRRAEAARALGERADGAAAAALIAALADESGHVRYCVSAALARIGRPVVPGLIEALESRNPIVRREVVSILETIGDREAIPAIVRRRNDEDEQVRWAVADALSVLQKTDSATRLT